MGACSVATAGLVVVSLLAGRCRIATGSGIALSVLAVLYVAAPDALKGTANLDARFAIMLGFLLFGAVLPTRLPGFAFGGLALLFAVRMTVLGVAWVEHRHDLADVRAAIAGVEPGARVFIAKVVRDDGPTSRRLSTGTPLDDHLPALLLIEHRAFWPFLFDNAGQQPVDTLPPYRELAQRAGAIPDFSALEKPGGIDLCGFTDLLLLNANAGPDAAHLVTDLVWLAGNGYAALFRIKAAGCALSSRSGNR